MFFVSRETKHKFIDNLESRCKQYNLSLKSLGIIIRSYHYSMPFILILLMCLGNHWIAIGAIISYFTAAIMFFSLNGCFISMLENRICNDDFNMVDPLLEVCKEDINDKNRMEISYYVLGYYTTIFFAIYYFRFQIKLI